MMNNIWLGFCFLFLYSSCNIERRVGDEVARLRLQDAPTVMLFRDTVFYRDTVLAVVPEAVQENEVLADWFAVPEMADTVLDGATVRLEIRRDTVIRFRTVVKERGIAVPVIDTIYLTRQVPVPASATHADRWAWLYALAAGLVGLVLFLRKGKA